VRQLTASETSETNETSETSQWSKTSETSKTRETSWTSETSKTSKMSNLPQLHQKLPVELLVLKYLPISLQQQPKTGRKATAEGTLEVPFFFTTEQY
jgi:hypothetical protein